MSAGLDALRADSSALSPFDAMFTFAHLVLVARAAAERQGGAGTMGKARVEPHGVNGRPAATPCPGTQVIGTGAGHDAGVLATHGIPAAMRLVRNPSGVSPSPAEHADPVDRHAGVAASATVLGDLTGDAR